MISLGCQVTDIYCKRLFFVDHILLLSASVTQLQWDLMLNICSEFAVITDVKFSHKIKFSKDRTVTWFEISELIV